METTEGSNKFNKAIVILILQVIAWWLILSPYFEDYSAGNDAAGAGMAKGLGLFLVGVPCMIFVFFTTLYFFKKNLPIWFRYISIFNYIGLIIIFMGINW
jgi:hypothetical protein